MGEGEGREEGEGRGEEEKRTHGEPSEDALKRCYMHNRGVLRQTVYSLLSMYSSSRHAVPESEARLGDSPQQTGRF